MAGSRPAGAAKRISGGTADPPNLLTPSILFGIMFLGDKNMTKYRYTDEALIDAVKNSVSVMGTMEKLGVNKFAGGTHSHLSKRIKQLNIDTSHFTGQASNRGDAHKGGSKKKTPQDILSINTSGRREKAWRLRRAMIESGAEYKCCVCGIQSWNERPISLEVDHINRDWCDNRIENVRFICPNCHSQTDGHNGSKGYTDLTSNARYSRMKRERARGGIANPTDLGSVVTSV